MKNKENRMQKIYYKIVALLVVLIGLIGYVLPMLISAKSTEAVLLGFILIIVGIPSIYSFVNHIVTVVKIKLEERKNEEN